jgi:hypothetical protein
MIAVVVLFVAAASAAITQPSPSLLTQRGGRAAEVRLVNQLTNPGANFNLLGQPFTGQGAKLETKIGSNAAVQATLSAAQGVTIGYTSIDTGNGGTASFTVVVETTTPVTLSCTASSISAGTRATVVLRETGRSAPSFPTSTATCPSGQSGTCTGSTPTSSGTVNVACEVFVESLAASRDCKTVPVRFYNVPTDCNVPLLEVAKINPGATTEETTFLTGFTLPASPNSPLSLPRQREIKIKGSPLFAAQTKARFIDAFINPTTGALVGTPTVLNTAFLNVANLAHRVDSVNPNNAVNQFVFVIVKGSVTELNNANLKDVVHFQQQILPGFALTNWVEVEAVITTGSQYSLLVYPQGTTDLSIFGNIGATTPVPVPSVTPLATATATVQPNDVRVFRIANGPDTTTVTANSVPFSTDSAPFNEPVLADNTRFFVWNNLVHNNISPFSSGQSLAAPLGDCCNVLADGDTTASVNFQHNIAGGPNTLSPVVRNGNANNVFKVFNDATGKACFDIGAPITLGTVTLNDQTSSSSECAVQGGFLFGRVVNVQSTACVSTSTGTLSGSTVTCPSVTATGSPVPPTPTIVGLNGGASDTSATSTVSLFLNVPLCDCDVPAPSCPAVGCDEQRVQLAQVAAIASLISSSTSAVTAAVTASQNALGAVLADTNADVGNTNSTLLAAINTRTSSIPTISSDVTAIRSDIRRLRNEVGDVEDAVEDVEDAVDDVQDAVDDL